MAIYSSADLLSLANLLKVNEIDAKITSPNVTGGTSKIDAVDHNEVDTALLNLLKDVADSSYNKIDGLLLSDIITGDDGDILQWDAGTLSWVTNPFPSTGAAGNTYEIQYNDNGNFGSSSNFTYDFDLSTLNTVNSSVVLELPAAGTNNFVVTKDNTLVDNLIEVDSDSDAIKIGATDSNITLRRGVTALDENLILEENQLTLSNADFLVMTSSNADTPGFRLTNSNSQNLITYNNDGTITRNVNFTTTNNSTILSNKSLLFNLTDLVGEEQVTFNRELYTFNPDLTSSSLTKLNETIFTQSNTNTNAGLGGYLMQFNGVTRATGFWSNAMFLTGTSTANDFRAIIQNPSIYNGYAYMSSNENIGFETKRILAIDGSSNTTEVNSLLRLKRGPSGNVANYLTVLTDVGGGVALDFEIGYAGRSDGIGLGQLSSLSDRIGSRIAELPDPDSPATSELFFETTEVGVNSTPLLLTGKDVTVGTTDSNIRLQRGTSSLDESLTLQSELLELDNAHMTIKGTTTDSTSAFRVNNSAGTRSLNVTNDGYVLGSTTASRVGFDSSNYSLFTGGQNAIFVGGTFRFQVLSTVINMTVPLSVTSITGVNNLTSGAEMIFRSASGAGSNPGFDMRYYAGKGGGSTFVSGKVKLGYRQQNNVDVDILTIRERTANSTDGIARIIFAIEEEYADNAAATGAGLPVNTLYKTPTGEVRIVV